jgi:hypothetical protein
MSSLLLLAKNRIAIYAFIAIGLTSSLLFWLLNYLYGYFGEGPISMEMPFSFILIKYYYLHLSATLFVMFLCALFVLRHSKSSRIAQNTLPTSLSGLLIVFDIATVYCFCVAIYCTSTFYLNMRYM